MMAATPTTMAMSAILKTGHIRKSKKSMTCPKRTRSIRLPRAPPSRSAVPQRKKAAQDGDDDAHDDKKRALMGEDAEGSAGIQNERDMKDVLYDGD